MPTLRLVPPVRATVQKIVYLWRCWNCGRPVKVASSKYFKLQRGELSGIQCARCLRPPSGSAMKAA
jgi:hypothetical protein